MYLAYATTITDFSSSRPFHCLLPSICTNLLHTRSHRLTLSFILADLIPHRSLLGSTLSLLRSVSACFTHLTGMCGAAGVRQPAAGVRQPAAAKPRLYVWYFLLPHFCPICNVVPSFLGMRRSMALRTIVACTTRLLHPAPPDKYRYFSSYRAAFGRAEAGRRKQGQGRGGPGRKEKEGRPPRAKQIPQRNRQFSGDPAPRPPPLHALSVYEFLHGLGRRHNTFEGSTEIGDSGYGTPLCCSRGWV